MTVTCPLSGSSDVVLLEKVSTKILAELYEKSIGESVLSEFDRLSEIGFYHCAESDLKFFHPAVTGSESFYEKLQKFSWYYLEDKEEFKYALNHIKPSDTVLEIGCGNGTLAEKLTVQEYVGLEFSQQAQTYAREKNIKVLNESIEEHAKKHPEKYSVVCSFQVLEHVADIHSFIKASLKCLKPGGILIYSVPRADCFIASVKKNMILNMPPHHLSWWSTKSLQYVAQIFNLEIIDIHYDKLAEVHARWYGSSVILRTIEKATGYDNKSQLIDNSVFYKIMLAIATFGSKLIEKRVVNSKELPDGHSITSVYQKPKA
ncbi:methyltransferase domain-containing protein [Pleurocapsales cyanobacterium LEGE 10410]|nr:methyltransferase domain-containing protein [Pleurocapsales cyanobacterium LEGE 10410]